MTAPAPAPLDFLAARRLTRELRDALDLAVDLLGQAFTGRAWVALDYPSWEAYCATELPQLAILGKGLPVEQRRATVAQLRGQQGMSLRAIAVPLGLSPNTVRGDLAAGDVQLATVTSLDGRARPAAAATRAPAPVVSGAQRTVDLVAAAGDRGLTVRELCKRTGWHHGQASGQLSRLAARRRVRAVAVFRDGCAAYVLP